MMNNINTISLHFLIMQDTELLFSFLRFVALVAPAIAILMQVVSNSEDSSPVSFRFLETGFFILILGGIVIFYQLLLTIDGFVTYAGSLLIFLSLGLVALAIAWNSYSVTRNLQVSIHSIKNLKDVTIIGVGKGLSFSIPFLVFYMVYHILTNIIHIQLNIKPEDSTLFFEPFLFYGVVMLIVSLRMALYLANVGYIENYSIKETFYASFVGTFAMFGAVAVFIVPVIVFTHLIMSVEILGLDLSSFGGIRYIHYFWSAIVVVAVLAVDIWAEKEDGERLIE